MPVSLQLQYQQWMTGQPDNRNNGESCVEIGVDKRHFSSGLWNDVRCEKTNGFTCQITKGKSGIGTMLS